MSHPNKDIYYEENFQFFKSSRQSSAKGDSSIYGSAKRRRMELKIPLLSKKK